MEKTKKPGGVQLGPSSPTPCLLEGGESNESSSLYLNVWQGAALLTADCLGTGMLALPQDVKVLGRGFGVGFLILNLPINLYAGTILSDAAGYVEGKHAVSNLEPEEQTHGEMRKLTLSHNEPIESYESVKHTGEPCSISESAVDQDAATFDFIEMTSSLFQNKNATVFVMVLFYTNIFLVLGNYILVMSHAVSSMFGGMCIPEAGLIASFLMFAVSQLRTMAKLGRSASVISLLALFVVVSQCLYYVNTDAVQVEPSRKYDESGDELSLLRKFSAMGSIGFAVGSQKLFLNIRHEIADRSSSPRSLALSLCSFGAFYVAIVLSAGPDPPDFLFDAIPMGHMKRIGGFFLWIHLVVSYAINSQALCSSMDRLFFRKWHRVSSASDDARWMFLTAMTAASAFVVANSIPFFKDLVAFIGALTSVPLTLLLPAVFHRKVKGVPLWTPARSSLLSFGLVTFSVLFMVTALVGSVHSISSDWEHHIGGFFSCNS